MPLVLPVPTLTAAQRWHLADRLLEERSRALRSLNGARGDRAPTLDAVRAIAEIDRALRRLCRQPERFGRDETTDEPIALDRLEREPWARHAA